MEEKQGLDRYLSPLNVWAMALDCMVGWGAFVMPGTTFLPAAGPAGTLIAFAVGTVMILIIGTDFPFLMAHSPSRAAYIHIQKMHLAGTMLFWLPSSCVFLI